MADGSSSGPGLFTLLGVLFIGLKLAGYIEWSWLWVLAPLWGGFVIVSLLLILTLVVRAL